MVVKSEKAGVQNPSLIFTIGATMTEKCHNCGSTEETIRESGNSTIVDCAACGINKHIHTKEDTTNEPNRN